MFGEPVVTITAPSRVSEAGMQMVFAHLQEVYPSADGYHIQYERSNEVEGRFFVTRTGLPPFVCDECDTPHPRLVHLRREVEVEDEVVRIGVAVQPSITRSRE